MDGGMLLLHFLTEPCKLFGGGPACILVLQNPDRMEGQGRAVLPKLSNQSLCVGKGNILAFQTLLQVLTHAGMDHPAVKAQDSLLGHVLL